MDRQPIFRNDAFTLIELMLALFIFFILVLITTVSWSYFVAQYRVTAAENRLVNFIALAQAEAIRRGETVTLCGSGDLRHCDGQWQKNILVKLSDETFIRSDSNPGHLIWQSSLNQNQILQFEPDGGTRGQQGAFYLCPSHRLVINRRGRLRLEQATVYPACSF